MGHEKISRYKNERERDFVSKELDIYVRLLIKIFESVSTNYS